MEEIKDGEYVRTKLGTIAKIEDVEFDIKFRIDTGKPIYRNWKEDFGGSYLLNEEIIKHSPNIMELIEYGDLIKFKTVKVTDMIDGKEREFNFLDAKFCDGWTDNKMIYDMDYLIDKDQSSQIEWVLTREQISNNLYKV